MTKRHNVQDFGSADIREINKLWNQSKTDKGFLDEFDADEVPNLTPPVDRKPRRKGDLV